MHTKELNFIFSIKFCKSYYSRGIDHLHTITKNVVSQSLNDDCSLEVHSVLATASGDHL